MGCAEWRRFAPCRGDASSTKDPTMSRLEADKQRELWNDIARNRKKGGSGAGPARIEVSYSTGFRESIGTQLSREV